MDLKQAEEKLKKYGQEHLLRFYDELDQDERSSLLGEIEKIDFGLYDVNSKVVQSDDIEPIKSMSLKDIDLRREEFFSAGLSALKKGEVACVLLAGGQGTRLGFDGPKGTLDIGISHPVYIFQIHMEHLKKRAELAKRPIPVFIMTSEINDQATRKFFEEHDYFGYDKDHIYFFVQEMAPATDWDGKVYLESKGHIALSPNGNGGWFYSLAKAGYLKELKEMGVEWINVFGVDNVLQNIADPYFIGASKVLGYPSASKVIKKASPDEKVGVMCLRAGHPSIVEYIDLTDEMIRTKDENGDPAYDYGVILNYLFSIKSLIEISKKRLPLHVVDKKIPHINEDGVYIEPSEPNGHKFEQLVLDMIEMFDDCLVYEVIRDDEFAPIKNARGKDSIDTARNMLIKKGIEL